MDQVWAWLDHARLVVAGIPDGLATVCAGFLALIAGYLAWHGIQNQIREQRRAEARAHEHQTRSLEQALTAEIVAQLPQLFRELSHSNVLTFHGAMDPSPLTDPFPSSPIYSEVIGRVGELRKPEHTAAIVEFHGNIAAFNRLVELRNRNFAVDNWDYATALRRIARNAADLLRMLNPTLPWPIHPGHPAANLYCPDGRDAARHNPVNTVQLLRLLGGPGVNGEVGSAYPELNPEPPVQRPATQWTRLKIKLRSTMRSRTRAR